MLQFFSGGKTGLYNLFRRENYIPTAVIKLQCCENTDVVNGVLNGSIDLGFILSDTNISNPNIKLHTIISTEPQIFFSVNSPLNKNGLTINDFADYPIVTTKYLIEKNDYRMINLLPFTPKGIEIVKSYDDIPIYLATGLYITLLRPYVNLANNKNIMSYKLPDSYQYRQGITMIWFNHNKNKYMKRILSILYRTDEQNESNRNTQKSPEIL
uniref:LysR family transcriptional regulator substrate-binding protein n=1 Tax=Enterocloster clostridioformis TaxID=1531 RepID=UPI000A5885BA|nr:LysR family transcriptional regulator substrate-binding protein [Enterocloster clostridioformis]